jgi:hypothetical protein
MPRFDDFLNTLLLPRETTFSGKSPYRNANQTLIDAGNNTMADFQNFKDAAQRIVMANIRNEYGDERYLNTEITNQGETDFYVGSTSIKLQLVDYTYTVEIWMSITPEQNFRVDKRMTSP